MNTRYINGKAFVSDYSNYVLKSLDGFGSEPNCLVVDVSYAMASKGMQHPMHPDTEKKT